MLDSAKEAFDEQMKSYLESVKTEVRGVFDEFKEKQRKAKEERRLLKASKEEPMKRLDEVGAKPTELEKPQESEEITEDLPLPDPSTEN